MAPNIVRRAYWRDVWRRVVRPKSFLDWAESVALVLFPIGLVWFALGREKAMEEVVTTALYMTAAAVVAGIFVVLRLANAAADVHVENLNSIARIESERDTAIAALKGVQKTSDDPTQAQLKQVSALLLQAEQLERKIIRKRGNDETDREQTMWFNEATKYIRNTLGEDYQARFKSATEVVSYPGYPVDGRPVELLSRIRGRKIFLQDLLKEIRTRGK
jgi:hypothetical protein